MVNTIQSLFLYKDFKKSMLNRNEVIKILSEDYGLEYVLEVNDITHEKLIEHLIEYGLIDYEKFFVYEREEQD